MATQTLNKAKFDTLVLNFNGAGNEWNYVGERPALIDFYAPWCGPCRQLGPILEELAEQYAGQVDIYKVNVDEEDELANMFNIRSIPTLLFVPKDNAPSMLNGAYPKQQLAQFINDVLINK